MREAAGSPRAASVPLEGQPGCRDKQSDHDAVVDGMFARAISLSPAEGEFWLAWGSRLWEKAKNGDAPANRLLDHAARCYEMAVELRPKVPSVHERAIAYFLWYRQWLVNENASESVIQARALAPLKKSLGYLIANNPDYRKILGPVLKEMNLPESELEQVLAELQQPSN